VQAWPAAGEVRDRMARIDDKWRVLIAVAAGTFLVVLNQTIMNVALPRIMVVFGASIDEAQFVLTSFMLATAIIMPVTPFLSDRWGSRRVYIVSTAAFTIGSLLCGLAWSMPSLVLARVIQGLGGGMIQPLGMAMLFHVTPPAQRGTIMGLYALPVMLGPILGPTVGGYLVEYVDWRWIFYLNVPVGALAISMAALLLRETPRTLGRSFDTVGFVLAALCTSGALLGMSQVAGRGWSDPIVIAELTLAIVTLPLFVIWELRTPQPLLNLRLFAIPGFSIGAVVNFVAMITLFGSIFLVPVFLQNLRGLGPMQTGLMLVPQAVVSTISIVLGGRLYDRLGARPLVIVGLLITAVSTWPLTWLDLTTPDAALIFLLALRGAATGLLVMPAITAWLASAPPSQTGAASALNNVMRQLYSTFGTALFASLLASRQIMHTANLGANVMPDAPAVAALLAQAQQFALAHGLSLEQGRALATAQVAALVRQAAMVRAFDDCFVVATAFCVIGLIPAFFLSGWPSATAAPARPAPAPAAPLRPRQAGD
jgi:DHA2 family multidrug resistance protein